MTNKLLELARQSIKNALENKTLGAPPEIKKQFFQKKACFVTLTIGNQLRGCIGSLIPRQPLYKDVIENAVNAAFHDPRFPPLSKQEFNKIKIEISILEPPKKLNYKTPQDLLEKLSKDQGVILKKGPFQATYLPQVWEQLPEKEIFLSTLCQKAGLNPNCWKQNPEIYTYKVTKIQET